MNLKMSSPKCWPFCAGPSVWSAVLSCNDDTNQCQMTIIIRLFGIAPTKPFADTETVRFLTSQPSLSHFSRMVITHIFSGVRWNCYRYQIYTVLAGGIVWRCCHDDVMAWKPVPRYWPFVRGIHRWPVDSPHKGPDVTVNKILNKQLSCRWFKKPWRSWWHHCNASGFLHLIVIINVILENPRKQANPATLGFLPNGIREWPYLLASYLLITTYRFGNKAGITRISCICTTCCVNSLRPVGRFKPWYLNKLHIFQSTGKIFL